MIVRTRNPQFRIRAVTKNAGEITFDQTHGSVLEITTQRRIGQAAGSFQITLLPRKAGVPFLSQTNWYDLFEAMDYLEIWMWVPPGEPDRPIMRGFVDAVAKEFAIQNGQPQRVIVVAGRDYGKLGLISKLYWVDQPYAVQVEILKKWHDGIQKLFGDPSGAPSEPAAPAPPKGQPPPAVVYTPAKLLGVLWEQFVRPQQDLIRVALLQDALRNRPPTAPSPVNIPECHFAPMVDSWENDLTSFDPRSVAQNIRPFTDIWLLMSLYQHDPWRELFFDEDVDGPRLFYRPTPWIDRQGGWVQDPSAFFFPADVPGAVQPTLPVVESFLKNNSDIVDVSLSRSEARLKNFFFTYVDNFASFATLQKELGRPLEGAGVNFFRGNPFLVGHGNTSKPDGDYRRFGFRLFEARTRYHNWIHQADKGELERQIAEARKQGLEGNLRLVKALDHEALLEFGTVVLAGDERVRMGHYLSIPVDETTDSFHSKYYINGVQHNFRQGTAPGDGRYVTICDVVHGRGHIERERLF